MKTPEILDALRLRYAMPEYALIENVANGVGMAANGRRRFADALAMQQFGKSGHYLHGFEVKASRADWLRELKDPHKADSVMRYCDYWWLVVGDAAIVKEGELPNGWGLLVPRGDRELVCKTQPTRQVDVIVHDRAFVAAIFRRAREQTVDEKLILAARAEGYRGGEEFGKRANERALHDTTEALKELRAKVAAFEESSGITIADKWGGHYPYGTTPSAIGAAVRVLLAGEQSVMRAREGLRDMAQQAERIAAVIHKTLGDEDAEGSRRPAGVTAG